jgi:hypothetical protein
MAKMETSERCAGNGCGGDRRGGINVSTQGRVHRWMTQELKASGGADADAHRYQGSSLETEGTSWIRARGRIGVMLRAAQSMINPGQFVLELILVVAALALSRSLAVGGHRIVVLFRDHPSATGLTNAHCVTHTM